MQKSYVYGLVLAGLSLGGCGEEEAAARVSEDVAWQFACNEVGQDCRNSGPAHESTDEVKLAVSCKKTTAGLQIRLEDPGNYNPEPGLRARPRGVLEISNANLEAERCDVVLEEYSAANRAQRELRIVGRCEGNASPGKCVLEGGPGNGYAFDGTLYCDEMKINNIGEPEYILQRPGENEPVVLQITKCD